MIKDKTRKSPLIARDGMDVALTTDNELSPVPLLYDYSQLSPDCQERVRQSATKIKRTVKRSAVTIGNALTEAKSLLNHGQWFDWLQTEFDWTERTAENAMNAARLVSKNEKFS